MISHLPLNDTEDTDNAYAVNAELSHRSGIANVTLQLGDQPRRSMDRRGHDGSNANACCGLNTRRRHSSPSRRHQGALLRLRGSQQRQNRRPPHARP